MLSKKIENLSSSLEKFMNGAKLLDSMIAPMRASNDKTGLGYHDSCTSPSVKKFKNIPPTHRHVAYRHSQNSYAHFSPHKQNEHSHAYYKKSSNHHFQRTSTYFKNACMHCSLHSHDSPDCPNRYRIDSRRYKWVVKCLATNPQGPKIILGDHA